MRKYPTYFLTPVPITGTITERYARAVEARTEEEYDIVVGFLEKRYGVSKIKTMFDLTGLQPEYAIFDSTSQYIIFFNDPEVRDLAQVELFNFAKRD